MEGDDHQRRQYEQPSYPPQYVSDIRSNPPATNVSERMRQSQLIAERGPASAAIRGPRDDPQDLGSFGYQQSQQYPTNQMHGAQLQYQPDYNQDPQRPQQFAAYTSQLMYNAPQQHQTQLPYEAAPQYHPRQSAALEVLPTQFGVQPFYHSSESTGVSRPTSTPQEYSPTHFQQSMPYQGPGSSIGRPAFPPTFPSAMTEYQPSAADTREQQEPESPAFDEAYSQYQEALKQTLENASKGKLVEAGQSLLEISEWLLSHASDLGLVSDDQALHEERLKLWNEFNTCWLAVLQRQKDDTQQMLDTGRSPTAPQSLLQEEFLENMGSELVRLCDGMEKYGLVDYQMGVWEEEIISILTKCLDLLSSPEDESPEAGPGDGSVAQESSGD